MNTATAAAELVTSATVTLDLAEAVELLVAATAWPAWAGTTTATVVLDAWAALAAAAPDLALAAWQRAASGAADTSTLVNVAGVLTNKEIPE